MKVLLSLIFAAAALLLGAVMFVGPALLLVGLPVYLWFRKTIGRIKEMAALAQRLHLQFWPSDTEIPRQYAFLDRIGEGKDVTSMNLLEGEYGGHFVRVFDCIRHPRTPQGRQTSSVFVLEMDRDFPELHIFPRRLGAVFEQMRGSVPAVQTGGQEPIDVYCREPAFARAVCHPAMMDYLRQHRDLPIEIERDCVALVFDHPLKPGMIEQRLKQLVEIANQIPDQLPNAGWMHAPGWQPQDPERWRAFEELAAHVGVQHRSWDPVSDNKYLYINDVHQYARTRGAFNVLDAQHDGHPARVFDYHHPTSAEVVKDLVFFVFDVDRELPTLQVYPAGAAFRKTPDGMVEVPIGGPSADIDLESAEFSRAFVVRSSSRRFAYDFCHPRMMEFLMAHRDVRIEVKKNFVAFGFLKTLTPEEIEARFRQLLSIRTLFPGYLVDGGAGSLTLDDATKQGCLRSSRLQVNPLGCVIASAIMLAFMLLPLTCIGFGTYTEWNKDKKPRATPKKQIQLPAEKPESLSKRLPRRRWGTAYRATARPKKGERSGRNAQRGHTGAAVSALEPHGQPVVSVGAKKNELVRTFKNSGRAGERWGGHTSLASHWFSYHWRH